MSPGHDDLLSVRTFFLLFMCCVHFVSVTKIYTAV